MEVVFCCNRSTVAFRLSEFTEDSNAPTYLAEGNSKPACNCSHWGRSESAMANVRTMKLRLHSFFQVLGKQVVVLERQYRRGWRAKFRDSKNSQILVPAIRSRNLSPQQ